MTIWDIVVSTLIFIADNHNIQDRVTQLFSSERIRYKEDSIVPFFPEFSPDLTVDFWDVRATGCVNSYQNPKASKPPCGQFNNHC